MNTLLALMMLVPAAEPPPARELLNKMIASRRSFATADLRWTQESRKAPKMYRRSRFDGKNWTLEHVGDEDGVVRPDLLGEAGACLEWRYLTADGVRWQLLEWSPQVRLYRLETDEHFNLKKNIIPNMDARTIGVSPTTTFKDLDTVLPFILSGVSDEDLGTKDAGDGISTVTVKLNNSILTWWLDTKRGYNPVRIEQRRGDNIVSGAQIDLAFYDDHVWFPKRAIYTELRRDDPLIFTFEFTSAEFDRPGHPPTLTPADIGVATYTPVVWENVKGHPEGRWDGKAVITLDEFLRQYKSGELLRESLTAAVERFDRSMSGNRGSWPAWMSDPHYGVGKPSDVDAWETYVRRFCLIRKLDDRQKASAKSILEDCRKVAAPLLAKIKETQAKEKDSARKEAMLAPISNIFTSSLVPRLESLLTTPQPQPTSQPSTSHSAVPTSPPTPKQ